MKVNDREIKAALDAPDGKIRLYLLYGPDEASSNALARRLERAMGSDATRIDLDDAILSSDPARLSDEAASQSLFGGRSWIRIQPAAEGCLPAIEALLTSETASNPVVAVAGALKPTSGILKLAIGHSAALAFPSYSMKSHEAEQLAMEIAREHGLRLGKNEARIICGNVANDRALLAQEIEKIALYLDAAPDRPADVTLSAVEAVSATINDSAFSDLHDAVMGGKPNSTSDMLARLATDGIPPIASARMLQKRVMLLAELRAEMESQSSNPAATVNARGNAIFFRDKPAITRELGAWRPEPLQRALDLLLSTERAMKSAANAGDVIGDADIVRLSRVAARQRQV